MARNNLEYSKIILRLLPSQVRVLAKLQKQIDPSRSLEPSEIIGYMVDWVDTRLREDVFWKQAIKPRKKWKDHEVELLGTKPDKELAIELGRSAFTVEQKRLDLKIPKHREPDY